MPVAEVKPRALAAGVASFLPGLRRLTNRGSGGTGSTRYCYSVWLRHLVRARQAGLPTDPRCVAELGPGDSLGTGLAAILCGANSYLALDVKAHANADTNLRVFEELVVLFRDQVAIPDEAEFPAIQPKLSDYRFPSDILSPARMAASIEPARLDRIRDAIAGRPSPVTIGYKAPWTDPSVIVGKVVDFLISQAVLEHIDDLDTTYQSMHAWMKSGAWMSHSIDFSSHNLTRSWNGHWTLGERTWRLVRGTRRYLINREPLSTHLTLLGRYGFEDISVEGRRVSVARTFRPAGRFRNMSEADRETRGAFVQARAAHG